LKSAENYLGRSNLQMGVRQICYEPARIGATKNKKGPESIDSFGPSSDKKETAQLIDELAQVRIVRLTSGELVVVAPLRAAALISAGRAEAWPKGQAGPDAASPATPTLTAPTTRAAVAGTLASATGGPDIPMARAASLRRWTFGPGRR
jgi:hypothetical protein